MTADEAERRIAAWLRMLGWCEGLARRVEAGEWRGPVVSVDLDAAEGLRGATVESPESGCGLCDPDGGTP